VRDISRSLRAVILGRRWIIAVSASILSLLAMRELDWSEPFISELRNKVGVVIIRLKAIEDDKVGPRCRLGLFASVYGFEQVVIDNVKLRADMVGSQFRMSPTVLECVVQRLPCTVPVSTAVPISAAFHHLGAEAVERRLDNPGGDC
jgi:hypothetical protein